jgi:hypothetical protein
LQAARDADKADATKPIGKNRRMALGRRAVMTHLLYSMIWKSGHRFSKTLKQKAGMPIQS